VPFPPDIELLDRGELVRLVREQQAALERLSLEFEAKLEELSLIRKVADVLRRAEGLRQLTVSLVEVVISELAADFVCLMLVDAEGAFLTPVAVFSQQGQRPRPVERLNRDEQIPLDRGEVGLAMREGRPLILPRVEGEPFQPWPQILPRRTRSLVALPLVAREQVLGAMLLASLEPGALDQASTRTLSIICDHAASALANARLIDQLEEINLRLRSSEKKARQAREHLQHILDSAADVILITDPQGRISYANQAAAELGLDPGELAGCPLAELFSQAEKAAMMLTSPLRHSEELELELAGGGRRLFLVSTTPLPQSGEVLAILRDVTRRKALERQLLHAEKLASVGILAAGVAHEIGNPLSAISGYAQLLDKDDLEPELRREFSRAIASEAERINKIIRELLDYSRPSSFQGRATQVNPAVEAVLDMFFTQKRLGTYHLEIVRKLAPELPPVNIDRDQLQQVVLNLVMNAAQALEDQGGGTLTITTRLERGLVTLVFSDDGPGIDPEKLPLVFDPFFTTKPVGKGTGLGLAICHRIVSQAGGRIRVWSRPGQGARFTVVLPPAQAEGQEDQ